MSAYLVPHIKPETIEDLCRSLSKLSHQKIKNYLRTQWKYNNGGKFIILNRCGKAGVIFQYAIVIKNMGSGVTRL